MFPKKERSEFLVTFVFALIFWMVIALPGEPFSSLGIKNLIEHLLTGALLAYIVTLVIPYPMFTKRQIDLYLNPGSIFRFFLYIIRLCRDIILSGIDVARRVMRPTLLISPVIVEVDTPLSEDIEISLNANSITLTPGTITIEAKKTPNGSRFLVHCISQEAAESIVNDGGFVKRIQECFRTGGQND